MKLFKKYYMLLLLILCLSGVVVYGTYAMFTAVVETNDVVSMDTNLNYTFEMNGTQTLKVSGKSKMRFNAIVKNNMEGAMAYGLYYKMISHDALPEGVIIAEVTNTTTLTTEGEIAQGASIIIPVVIKNTTDTTIKVEIGVRMGYATQGVENIPYNDGEINITSTQTSEEAGNSECTAIMECTEECSWKVENGKRVEYCTCKTGNEEAITLRTSAQMLTYLQTISGDILGFTSNGMKTSVTGIATTDEGIWEAPDDYGTSYYWRGNTNNNYLKFGKDATNGQDLWWRIIRINGDGSIRIIYNGTSNVQTGTSTQFYTEYNTSRDKNAYVGYTYGTPGSNSYDGEHHGTNSSTIKTEVDTWYENNIKGKYDDKISNTLFCNDRQIASNSSSYGHYGTLGYNANTTLYASSTRVLNTSNQALNPSIIKLTCTNKADRYTTAADTEKGNGLLKYPVGLITSDEVVAAGALFNTENTSYYLYTNQTYWTMSPSHFINYSCVFRVHASGLLDSTNGDVSRGARPVLNLKSDVKLTGKGTSDEPFVVDGAV